MQAPDFIVVGSGSAGGIVAARLSEDGRYRVLCLEAGTAGPWHPWTIPPAGTAFTIVNPKVNWCRYSTPNETTANRPIYVAGGKLVGGTSAINGVIFNRGQRMDYDRWAGEFGCRGWSYEEVLPYFRKLECTPIGSDQYRGREGPIRVTEAEKTSPFFDIFIRSAEAAGYPSNPDYSGPTQYGVAMAQQTVYRGLRESTATRYMAPATRRKNFQLIKGAEVTSLLFEGKRCVGVRYRRNGREQEVRAAREVVLSAGTIGSSKLLELSGIGNPELLSRLSIPVRHALPGVGENLRDHFGPTLKWTLRKPGLSLGGKGSGLPLVWEMLRYGLLRRGFISQGLATLRVFGRSHAGVEQADLALLVNPYLIEIKNQQRRMSDVQGFFIYAQVQRPESTGSVHIRSSDPADSPTIDYRFLATENDCRTAVAAVRRAREIAATNPLAEHVAEEVLPGPKVQTEAEIVRFIRETGATTFHYVGTCRMGHDPMAVVDDRLLVHGIEGLRVADGSIMPMIISGNTSIPCMMIGEKCAAMMLADAVATHQAQ